MELNRKEVPLYGQVEGQITLQARAPVDAEYYVVTKGSRLTHVTPATACEDGQTLCFTVPGHDRVEAVSVTPYVCTKDQVNPCQGQTSLQYVKDLAQEAAEYLSANINQLDLQNYSDILKRFPALGLVVDEEVYDGLSDCRRSSGSEADVTQLDEKITQALANMDYPWQWEGKDSQPGQDSELRSRESLLQLAVRLGLVHLTRFLIHQPTDQSGETPVHRPHGTLSMLSSSSGSAGGLLPGLWCLWSDSSSMLRFCPGRNSVVLTVQQAGDGCPQDSILLLQKSLKDPSIHKLIKILTAEASEEKTNRDEGHLSDEGRDVHVEEDVLVDNVFEEQLVLSLDEDEEYLSSLSVNGHPLPSSEDQQQFIQTSTNAGLFMNSQSSLQTQFQKSDVEFRVRGVTCSSTGTDDSLWDSEDIFLATDTPPPRLDDLYSTSAPRLSPLQRLQSCPASSELTNQRESPPVETCDLSLVALEVDSEEENRPKSPLTILEKTDARKEISGPDLTCTRSQSASACEPSLKDVSDDGGRLRSYSYSSSKISFRPRFSKEHTGSDISSDAALHSVSHSRSLLQALSLSKSTLSLSLLHHGKQRVSTISDQSHEKREIRFRKRAQSADDEGSMELAESLQHLTLSEFLKEIEEEELDKYNIPAKTESEKYKVIRTFSFLKNRMSSTRNKSKGKGKDREAKDKLNGHRFATGSCLGAPHCVVCDKPASGKDLLHCPDCTAIVHKACKESVPPCLKKPQDKYAVSTVKSRTASLPQNFTVRDSPQQSAIPISSSLPVMTPKERRDAVTQSYSPSGSLPNSDSLLSESSETELEVQRLNGQSEEFMSTPLSSTSTDSCFTEDGLDSFAHSYSDILTDSVDFEAESWSLTVEHKFSKKQDKRVAKRQDVIYELMQTEFHHLQTLHIMAEVFRRGMKEDVQLDADAVERVFPCLDQLLALHHAFFSALKERRHSSGVRQEHRNYLIHQIGDILLKQFSDDSGDKMKQVYGEFCSRHNEAVSFFKELQQHNKRFHSFVKQQGSNSLVRRKEIPECILLVTQRITKYPVLLERILQYTQEDTEEHAELSKALAQIREVIAAVDQRVSEYERHQKLQEVWNRIDSRSTAKLKDGCTFRKQDMMRPGQILKHQGQLLWKTATGRLKDVQAVLLTDRLIFLQEKDQKYIFATVDQKPPVIALQKLIVREVANEERGMFLISASSSGPEMYEVHTSSKDERNTWMRLIREAVESCPEEEEEFASESEEEKKAAKARLQKIHKVKESLMSQDQQICSCLEEKLQIYSELSSLNGRTGAAQVEARLLVQPQSEELPQAAGLLAAALQEAENLKTTLSCSPSESNQDSDTDCLLPDTPTEPTSDFSEDSPDNPEAGEGSWTDALVLQTSPELQSGDLGNMDSMVAESVQSLTRLLYSLQAVVAIQDTCYEVQRLLLEESGRPSPRAQRVHLSSPWANTLQEQEKQRNLEKQKEEIAAAQRLHDKLRQDKERWERECQAKESQQGEQESRLEERERQCQLAAEKLKQEKEELDGQLEEYQQSLERLREGQRNVKRERERLEGQERLLQTWKHGRQSSLPAVIPHMIIPLDGQQVSPPSPSRGNGSVFVNEAVLTGTNNRHHKRNDPSAHNCLNTLLARTNNRRSAIVPPPHSQHSDSQDWTMGSGYLRSPTETIGLQHSSTDHNGETWTSAASGTNPYPVFPHPSDPQLDLSALVSLETDSDGEESREETIVYL
ncbi:rho guanine nucleotide exchange factor 28 isoform X1 [Oryzias melastigma]|uniref:Rho guanine nucleotide exchange factor (GEF) 28a n=2 Tax=Oryzias melastigma TaxID=30732 RepID=A0A3B3C5W4_ORYME|nr:rho guanine nucleotide exchange factor 28 isoform X1 [Oryzias melastigma]